MLDGPFKDKAGNEYFGKKVIMRNVISTLQRGFTEVKLNKKYVEVCHLGNMGNDLDSVRKNFDAIFVTPGAFDKLYENRIYEIGSPDYFYVVQMKR